MKLKQLCHYCETKKAPVFVDKWNNNICQDCWKEKASREYEVKGITKVMELKI